MNTIDLIALTCIPLTHPVLNHWGDDYDQRRLAFVGGAAHRLGWWDVTTDPTVPTDG